MDNTEPGKRAAVSFFANVLRVMRGAGSASRLPAGDDDIAACVQSWSDPYDGVPHDSPEAFEFKICNSALRLVAARLDGNAPEASRASRDLFGAINERDETIREKYRRDISAELAEKEAESEGRKCFVYFIGDNNGAIKIGRSVDPVKRLASLQTANANGLLELLAVLPHGETREARLHRKFSKRRLSGEWFEDCPEIRMFIKQSGGAIEAANDNGRARHGRRKAN